MRKLAPNKGLNLPGAFGASRLVRFLFLVPPAG